MDLNALKESAFAALQKVIDYLKGLIEDFIADKLA